MTVLGDLVEIFDGPHATPTRRDSGPYFLNISSLKSGRLDLGESDHVSEEDFVRWTRRMQPRVGDLLFSYETRLGEAALMPDDVRACLGRRMGVLRPNRALLEPRYLLYYFLSPSFQELISERTVHGATVPRLLLSEMGSWPIEVPDLATQTAIADVLGALDDKIAANERVLRLGDDLLRSRFAQLANSAEDWVPLSHYLALRYGKSLPSNQRRSGEVPVVGSGGPSGMHDVSLVKGPGIVVGRKGSIGTVWWCDRDFWPIDTAFYVEPVGGTGLRFAYALLRWVQLGEHNGDSAVPGLNRDVALAQPVPRVIAEHAEDFEALATPIMNLSQGLREETARLAATRDALLPELMSGRLAVKSI